MEGRTGSTLSRTKYVKCFRVEISCYRLVLRQKFIMTMELLYNQSESDFVQCQTKMPVFASRICSEFKQIEHNWNRILHQNALWSLVFSTTRPWNKHISVLDASHPSIQPGTMTGRRSETFEDLWYLFFSKDKYKGVSLYQREDWLIDWNQLQRCLFKKDPSLSLLPVVWSQRSMNFLKIQVIQYKSKTKRVAMIRLSVRTGLCTEAHFTRNEIKYHQSQESRLFFLTNVTCCPLHRNRRKAKNYRDQC